MTTPDYFNVCVSHMNHGQYVQYIHCVYMCPVVLVLLLSPLISQERLVEFDVKYIRRILERYPDSADSHILKTFKRLQYK